MQIKYIETDGRAISTGPLMHDIVKRYYTDMEEYAHLSLIDIFNLIKNIPFRPDPPDVETLMRPAYTMSSQGTGGDCDDKSIALAAWAYLKKIPYRFIAVRRPDKKELHHVYCELYLMGKWIHADPTYSFNTLGREREYYQERVII